MNNQSPGRDICEHKAKRANILSLNVQWYSSYALFGRVGFSGFSGFSCFLRVRQINTGTFFP
jgi:hypothetical protein